MKRKLLVWVASALLGACSGASSTGDSASSSLKDDAVWQDLDFNGRRAFMRDVVTPEMKPLLSSYMDLNCSGCHGTDGPEVNYRMPNTLAPLDPSNMPFESEDEKLRSAAVFMKEQIVPKMAGLLREAPYDPAVKKGFGCFRCHAKSTP